MAVTEHPPSLALSQRNSTRRCPEPPQQDLDERKRAELSIRVIEVVVHAGLDDAQPARKQLIDEHREPIVRTDAIPVHAAMAKDVFTRRPDNSG